MSGEYNQACESDAPPPYDGGDQDPPLWVVRRARETDWPFLIQAWVRANADSWLASALGHRYVKEHSTLAHQWLAHPRTDTRVAVDPADSDAILGFAVWSGTTASEYFGAHRTVHYVYVRPGVRRMGCAKAMLFDLPTTECEYSHRISKGTRYSGALIPETWSYNPYPFMRGPK